MILRQEMGVQEIVLAHRNPPAHEKIAQSDEKNHMHDVLDRERIKEMPGWMIEDQHRGASRQNQTEKTDEQNGGYYG